MPEVSSTLSTQKSGNRRYAQCSTLNTELPRPPNVAHFFVYIYRMKFSAHAVTFLLDYKFFKKYMGSM